MPFDIKKVVATAFLTLASSVVSGAVSATAVESNEFSAFSSPYLQAAPWLGSKSDSGVDTKYPLKAENAELAERCLDCIANGTHPDNALVPVTDFLSFAAAADPQINKSTNNPRASFQNDIASYLLAKVYNDSSYKGLIIAGDLTEHTYKWEILKFYNSLLTSKENELDPILERSKELNRLYEGLGNHDMRKGPCSVGIGNNSICERDLTNIISRDDRRDQISSQPPHYSWEWDGIRFVQLNLLPGDEAESVWNGSSRDPQDALKFLKDELADAGPDKNVIIVHHYGMDRFSNKWWTTETKNAYEEVIRDYRVVAMITGHLHWSRRSSNMQQCWNDITAITVGSLRLGFHLDFKIVDDHLTVSRLRNGSPIWSDSYSIGQSDTRFCGKNT